MLRLLIRIFIKDSENLRNERVRRAYGSLCAVYGVFLNLLLFAGKYFAGAVSGSVAIIADAFNNLSDAGSSIISLLGFAAAGKKPDPEHPFGHGRIEYLTGLVISVMIILMGFEIGKSSVEKILRPQSIQAGLLPALVLIASILVKFYMSMYNRSIGRKIGSAAMEATAADAMSDCVSTLVVLLSMGLSCFFGLNIDAWAGLAVAAFICYTGFCTARETLSPLLGKAPDRELVQSIRNTVLQQPEIIDVHDLIVHDYGPGHRIVSLHAEVDGQGEMFALHEAIDRAENELRQELGCEACIHMDPLATEDSELGVHRAQLSSLLQDKLSADISVHDLRMAEDADCTVLIFDAAIPAEFPMTDAELVQEIEKLVRETWNEHRAMVTVDRVYH